MRNALLILLAIIVSISAGRYISAALNPPNFYVPKFSGEVDSTLHACSRYEEAYEALGFATLPIDEWPKTYHNRVDQIIEEFISSRNIQCDAENYDDLFRAGSALTNLAKSLPEWHDSDVTVSRFDTPLVLLEYLRIYECALMEFERFLELETTKDEFGDTPAYFIDFFRDDLLQKSQEHQATISKELFVARSTLERVLNHIGAMERTKPLAAELECMQRMSLDFRNIAALIAETSACMPRTWNAKDALRDYAEKPVNPFAQ